MLEAMNDVLYILVSQHSQQASALWTGLGQSLDPALLYHWAFGAQLLMGLAQKTTRAAWENPLDLERQTDLAATLNRHWREWALLLLRKKTGRWL